jgi:hypothetical protein
VNGPRIHYARIEGILAVYETGFRLDLIIAFIAKNIIINHGALLKVLDEYLKIIFVIN